MWVLSSVIIIAQSDTKNIEYIICWVNKISLEQLLFEYGTFFPVLSSETYCKELVCLFCKSLLPFLAFVNCEGPYFARLLSEHFCLQPFFPKDSAFFYCLLSSVPLSASLIVYAERKIFEIWVSGLLENSFFLGFELGI